MNLHPLLKAFNDTSNLKNFLLRYKADEKSVTFIYPTSFSGLYTRLTVYQEDEYQIFTDANIEFAKRFGSTSIFETTPTNEQIELMTQIAADINQTYFKVPVIDLSKFKILHCDGGKVEYILGDVFLEDETGVKLQLSNNILYLDKV